MASVAQEMMVDLDTPLACLESAFQSLVWTNRYVSPVEESDGLYADDRIEALGLVNENHDQKLRLLLLAQIHSLDAQTMAAAAQVHATLAVADKLEHLLIAVQRVGDLLEDKA